MNVILMSLDTLRAEHLSCYGYKNLTSPHLDKIAQKGVLFTECFSTHIPTHPGHTTMFTGKDVFTHQIISQGSKIDLDPNIKTITEILHEKGYFTGAADNMGRWFSRSFDVYEGYQWETDTKVLWHKAEAVNKTVFKVLEQAVSQPKPFFLFFHYWDPHTPYLPPEPFTRMFYSRNRDEKDPSNHSLDEMWETYEALKYYFAQWMSGGLGAVKDSQYLNALYDAEIAYMDTALSELFARLDELELSDKTLIVISSDHGEELDDHKGCWYDHHGMYDTNLSIPLIMSCPGHLPAGKKIDGFVRLQDVAPTILDFLGLYDIAKKEQMEGMSTLPLIGSRSKRGLCAEMYITECTWMKKKGWRTPDWKLIESLEDPFNLAPIELYDMKNDPKETVNLADKRPDIVAMLRKRMEAWRERRIKETQKPDPHSYQEITLRQVGSPEATVPKG